MVEDSVDAEHTAVAFFDVYWQYLITLGQDDQEMLMHAHKPPCTPTQDIPGSETQNWKNPQNIKSNLDPALPSHH